MEIIVSHVPYNLVVLLHVTSCDSHDRCPELVLPGKDNLRIFLLRRIKATILFQVFSQGTECRPSSTLGQVFCRCANLYFCLS